MMQWGPLSAIMVLLVIRSWFLYYDLKYSQAVHSHKWWEKYSIASFKQSWFIVNKNKYGELSKYIYTLILISSILSIVVVIIGIELNNQDIYAATTTLFAVICTIFMIYLFRKMPKYYDVLWIRKEIRYLIIGYTITHVYFIVTAAAGLDQKYIQIQWVHTYVEEIIAIGTLVIPILYPCYISYRMTRDIETHRKDSDNEVETDNKYAAKTWQKYVNMKCDENEQDDQNWNRFMRHLIKEFAVENLCFVLEVIQFKQQFIPNYNLLFRDGKVKTENDLFGWFIKIPSSLPISSIIESNRNQFNIQVVQIYEKYIASSAELAINISSETRKELKHKMMGVYLNIRYRQSHKEEETTSENKIDTNKSDEKHEADASILKMFDGALSDIDENLFGSFSRLKQNIDINHTQDIIAVMMSETQ